MCTTFWFKSKANLQPGQFSCGNIQVLKPWVAKICMPSGKRFHSSQCLKSEAVILMPASPRLVQFLLVKLVVPAKTVARCGFPLSNASMYADRRRVVNMQGPQLLFDVIKSAPFLLLLGCGKTNLVQFVHMAVAHLEFELPCANRVHFAFVGTLDRLSGWLRTDRMRVLLICVAFSIALVTLVWWYVRAVSVALPTKCEAWSTLFLCPAVKKSAAHFSAESLSTDFQPVLLRSLAPPVLV